MAVLDTLPAAESLAVAFDPGGRSKIALAHAGPSVEAKADEMRLREHVPDIPAWARQAECFYVDPTMVPLVCSAGAVVPDDTHLEPHDLPAPVGFLVVGGGATLCHLHEPGGDGQISAEVFNTVLWAASSGHVYVARFELARDGWYLLDAATLEFGRPLPPPTRTKDRAYPRRLVIPGGQPDASHEQVALPIGPEARELMAAPESQGSDAGLRWVMACWRLMGQTIADIEPVVPTRQQRRQLERRNVPVRTVTVIRLRRRGSRGDGGTTVNWTHRWVVRGHWRQQPCKNENGDWTTRPVFIHPYIKGPDEAPLLVRRHVNHLVS